MRQVNRPTGLIAYDTDINAERRLAGKPPVYRLIRARTVMYAAIIMAVGGIMIYALATRRAIEISALHERNPLAVMLSDGGVRNDYIVRLLNKSGTARAFAIDIVGLPGATLQTAGIKQNDQRLVIDVGRDQTQEIRLSVKVDQAMVPAQSTRITILATDMMSGESASVSDHFMPANGGAGG
jgi:polyferredoxin